MADSHHSKQTEHPLRNLRLRAFLLWPVVMFALMELMYFFDARSRAVSTLLFALVVWVLFFRAYRDGRRLSTFRCPHCRERFFYTKVSWIFGYGNLWSNRCVHCENRVT